MNDTDKQILELSLSAVTDVLNALVGACMDEKGNPKAPTRGDIAKARAALPKTCSNAYQTK